MAYPRQLDKSRTVDRMLWFAAASICVCNLAVSIANGQQGRPRYLLSPSQIVGEMQNRQLPTRGVQVKLAAPITAAIADPPLEIQTVTLLNSHEMRLRMACRDRSECLPFFAIATFPEELSPTAVPAMLNGRSLDGRSLGKLLPVSEAGLAGKPHSDTDRARQADTAATPILHSGSPATLEFSEERVHIRIEVTCLESGAAGDKIRVTSRDHKQVYIAKIITPTLLKGTF